MQMAGAKESYAHMHISMTISARRRLAFWSCALVVLVLALVPTAPQLPTTGWDKGNHVLAFSVLTVLGCRAYPARVAAILAGLLLYGGLIEVLQSFTPYRLAEFGDLFADGIGILLGRVLISFSRQAGKAQYSR
jgi:VanZ family protein